MHLIQIKLTHFSIRTVSDTFESNNVERNEKNIYFKKDGAFRDLKSEDVF